MRKPAYRPSKSDTHSLTDPSHYVIETRHAILQIFNDFQLTSGSLNFFTS